MIERLLTSWVTFLLIILSLLFLGFFLHPGLSFALMLLFSLGAISSGRKSIETNGFRSLGELTFAIFAIIGAFSVASGLVAQLLFQVFS